MTDAATAEFGDIGHGAFVVVDLDARPNLLDKAAFEAFIDHTIATLIPAA